jgi:regulator of RNase E activity RraA
MNRKYFGHRPVVPPRIGQSGRRAPKALVGRLVAAYLPDISDAVGPLYTMDGGIRPLYLPIARLVGTALTVKAPPGDNLTVHGALSMVRQGDVLVIDWRGSDACATGAGSLIVPIRRGLQGAVVDGGWRDITELQAIGFPVFGRTVSPYSPPKSQPGEINVPVACGGVVVHPGDIVVADVEGVVVVPRKDAEAVAHSLRRYRAHQSIEEWDLATLEKASTERRAYFDAAVRDWGGEIRRDRESRGVRQRGR